MLFTFCCNKMAKIGIMTERANDQFVQTGRTFTVSICILMEIIETTSKNSEQQNISLWLTALLKKE